MHKVHDLERFLIAQEAIYHGVLAEPLNGQKESHWMCFIFPQIKGLGSREMGIAYAIASLEEA